MANPVNPSYYLYISLFNPVHYVPFIFFSLRPYCDLGTETLELGHPPFIQSWCPLYSLQTLTSSRHFIPDERSSHLQKRNWWESRFSLISSSSWCYLPKDEDDVKEKKRRHQRRNVFSFLSPAQTASFLFCFPPSLTFPYRNVLLLHLSGQNWIEDVKDLICWQIE